MLNISYNFRCGAPSTRQEFVDAAKEMVKKKESVQKSIGEIKRATSKEGFYTITGEIVGVGLPHILSKNMVNTLNL